MIIFYPKRDSSITMSICRVKLTAVTTDEHRRTRIREQNQMYSDAASSLVCAEPEPGAIFGSEEISRPGRRGVHTRPWRGPAKSRRRCRPREVGKQREALALLELGR